MQEQTIENPILTTRIQSIDEDLTEIHYHLAKYKDISKIPSSLPRDVERLHQRLDDLDVDEDKLSHHLSRARTIVVLEIEPYKAKYKIII